MVELTKAKDWSKHPLGDPCGWPSGLKTTLSMVLANRFPMFLWWGPELYCFYNDAYRPSLGNDGKHPAILGMPAKEAWSEIWPVIEPLIQQVLDGGGATWSEDQLIPIYRNGHMEDVYWTFSHSPVHDGSSTVAGVLVTCMESTHKVQMLNRIKESERQLHLMVQQAPVAVAIFKGPHHVVEIANQRALELWGRTAEQSMHRPIAHVMPELEQQGMLAVLDAVFHERQPFHATERAVDLHRASGPTTAYVNFSYEPLLDEGGRVNGVMAVGAEVTESVLARQRAEAGEKQFRILADSMPQFVWTADKAGHLDYFNRAVYEYSGLSEAELTNDGWLQIVNASERDANVERWLHSVSTGEPFLFEHRFRRHDGVERWQLSRAVPLHDDGNICMWVGTSTDIEDIKEQENEKDYFISMASHELRTPLATIKGYLHMLQQDHGSSEDSFLSETLVVMDGQVDRLNHLVGDMLDLSKMKAGSLDLVREPVVLNDLLHAVVDEMSVTNPEHIIQLCCEQEALVLADKHRIHQVVHNLLSNAVKYAPASRTIEVRSTVTEDAVTVAVRDHGIGIRPADQEKIFQRFFRVEGNNERTYPGFGIGLYIAADIVRRHHGQIGVTSALGEGSTFHFVLPLANAS